VSLPVRVATLLAATAVVVAGSVFVVIQYLLGGPPAEDFTTTASARQVNITMQTDPQASVTDKPDWVTYFIKNPQTGAWDHTTLFKVPAATRVNVTIDGFDGPTPLRNPEWDQVTGTIGGVEYVNGKAVSNLNSWNGDVQHTFQIAALNLNVPIAAEPSSKLCPTSPCSLSQPHVVTSFSFMTPATGGVFRWQCIVPCGLGYLDGNGGPMSTFSYMTGEMEVVG
jgi:hypothetical protein